MKKSGNNQQVRFKRYIPRAINELPVDQELIQQIGLYARQGRYELAVRRYAELLKTGPLHLPAEFFYYYARLLMKRRLYEQAEAVLAKAVSLQPGYQEAHSMMGLVLDIFGDYAQAESCLITAAALDPRDAITWARLSNLYSRMDQRRAALFAQQQAVKYKPDDFRLKRRLNEMTSHDQEDPSF